MADPPSHFFKFIPPGLILNLSIPISFWKNLNDGICKKATLRRGCHEWPVDISDEGGFGDGWRKFVRENGVQEFDFIVFKHQGNMVFDFMVFDQSLCEKQYPNLYDQEMDVEEQLVDSDSIHTHERSEKLKKRKRTDYSSQTKDKLALDDDRCFVTIMTSYIIKRSRLCIPMNFARSNGLTTKSKNTQIVLTDEAQRSWPAKLEIARTQIRLNGWRNLIINNHLEVGDACMFELVNHGEVPAFNIYNLGKKPIKNHIDVKETSSTKKKETTSIPQNHRFFISTLKPCTFNKSCLYLPVDFSIPNGLKMGEMILRDDKGRSWKVELKKNGEKHFYLGCGLKAFCSANGLKKGDKYKLELIENEKDKPSVMNFSYLGKKPTKHFQVKKKTSSALNHRYFVSTMKPTNFQKSGLYIPVEFSLSNDLKLGEMILKDDKDRSWKVQLNKHGEKSFYLSSGFKAFCLGNELKVGDTFKFELHENEKDKPPVVKFSLGVNSLPCEEDEHPYFNARMKPYNIEKSILNLPNNFAKMNGLNNKEEMILINVKDERSWTVELERSMTNYCFIGRGWRDFHLAYDLKEGDCFRLELVKNGEKPIANFYLQEKR